MSEELPPLGIWYAIHFQYRHDGTVTRETRFEERRVANPVRYLAALRAEYAGRAIIEEFKNQRAFAEARDAQ